MVASLFVEEKELSNSGGEREQNIVGEEGLLRRHYPIGRDEADSE